MTQTPLKQDNNAHAQLAPHIAMQLDPDYFYTIWLGDMLLAQIVATGPTDAVVVSLNGRLSRLSNLSTEYWYVSSRALEALKPDAKITITATPFQGISASTLRIQANTISNPLVLSAEISHSFNSDEAPCWVQDLAPPPLTSGTTYRFFGPPEGTSGNVIYILLNVTPDPDGGPFRLSGVQWCLTGRELLPPRPTGEIQPGSPAGISYSYVGDVPKPYWGAKSL